MLSAVTHFGVSSTDCTSLLVCESFVVPFSSAGGTGFSLYETKDFGQNWTKLRIPVRFVGGTLQTPTNDDTVGTDYALVGSAKFPQGNYNASLAIYRCPADRVLSEVQKQAGWSARVRSYSMNAMVGDAGENSRYGTNFFNPEYKQFKKFTDFVDPTSIFVFLDEHPDSLNDVAFAVECGLPGNASNAHALRPTVPSP